MVGVEDVRVLNFAIDDHKNSSFPEVFHLRLKQVVGEKPLNPEFGNNTPVVNPPAGFALASCACSPFFTLSTKNLAATDFAGLFPVTPMGVTVSKLLQGVEQWGKLPSKTAS
jgi:hypothetical protein